MDFGQQLWCDLNFVEDEGYDTGSGYFKRTVTLSTRSVKVSQKLTGFLHHNQDFDDIIEKTVYAIFT